VLLMPNKDGKVSFMAIPAPTKPGQLPVFGKPGSPEVLGAIATRHVAPLAGWAANHVRQLGARTS
jgi:hypothetical protein